MSMHLSRYHSVVKISALVVAIVLLFDGGFVSPITKQLSDQTIIYLATVGSSVTAQVAPTEINTITAELTARERELNAREAELLSREIASRDFGTAQSTDYSIYVLSLILFVLATLIVLNYAMDWVRVKNIRYEKKVA